MFLFKILSRICLMFFISIPFISASKKQILEEATDLTKEFLTKSNIEMVNSNVLFHLKGLEKIKKQKNVRGGPKHTLIQIISTSNELGLTKSSRPETVAKFENLMKPTFQPLKAFNTQKSFHKILKIKRKKTNDYAHLFFQKNGLSVPLGYSDESEDQILHKFDIYFGLKAKILSVDKEQDATTQNQTHKEYILREIYVDDLTEALSKGKKPAPKWHHHISSLGEQDMKELNEFLKIWYEFKNIKIQEKYMEIQRHNVNENSRIELIMPYHQMGTNIQKAENIWNEILNQRVAHPWERFINSVWGAVVLFDLYYIFI